MVHYRINFLWSLLLWIGFCGLTTVQAQLCDKGEKPGGFSINGTPGSDPIIACAPLSISVTNSVAGANNIKYVFDYKGEDASSLDNIATVATTFTYSKPGRYRILQVGSSNASSITACREVIVRDNTPPKATYTSCFGGKIKLTFADDSITRQYDQIEIQWNSSSSPTYLDTRGSLEIEHPFFGSSGTRNIQYRGVYTTDAGSCRGSATVTFPVEVNTTILDVVTISKVEARADGSVGLTYTGIEGIDSEVLVRSGTAGAYARINVKSSKGGQQQITLPGLDSKEAHCLKIRTTDACGNFTESNEVCTVVLSGTAGNERNPLSWNTYPVATGFEGYEILRNTTTIQTRSSISETSYTDNDVECGVSYRYQVLAVTDKAISVSVPIELTAKSDSKPGTISEALVSVEQNGSVSLVAFPPVLGATPTYKMIFERADSPEGNFRELASLDNTNRYSDATAATSKQSYCYRVVYENTCGNRSEPSEAICTVFLKDAGSAIRWTGESPFTDDVNSYFVIKLNKGGASSETGVGLKITYDPQFDDPNEQEFNYQIRVTSQSGAFLSYSNVILFRREPKIFLPDAFSPNGDIHNDTFAPKGTFYDDFQLVIYNRWGQSIFQTKDAAGWDGTLGTTAPGTPAGAPAPEGQYVYKVVITDSIGREFVKSGTVLLLR